MAQIDDIVVCADERSAYTCGLAIETPRARIQLFSYLPRGGAVVDPITVDVFTDNHVQTYIVRKEQLRAHWQDEEPADNDQSGLDSLLCVLEGAREKCGQPQLGMLGQVISAVYAWRTERTAPEPAALLAQG